MAKGTTVQMRLTEDALSIAVGAVDYFTNCPRNGPGMGTLPLVPFTVRWFVAHHPCDDGPYLVGVDFER